MASPSSSEQALQRWFGRTTRGIKPGLERVRLLSETLGHPEKTLACIHVAGTNGKGSVCAMIESVLRAAGLRTGLYTSPHLVRFHERIRVSGTPIPEADLIRWMDRMDGLAAGIEKGMPEEARATFFELTTALAFGYFAEQGVQIAVVETGMGGRWDATNILVPVLSVITEIDFDHADYLGNTLRLIAKEKAGIVKPGRPVVMGVVRDEAARIIEEEAAALNAPVRKVEECVSIRRSGKMTWTGQRLVVEAPEGPLPPLHLPLLGDHQINNAALAVCALRELSDITGEKIPSSAWQEGMKRVQWPARLQVLGHTPPVLLDGAHNPHGLRAWRRAVESLAGKKPVGLVFNMMSDKDVQSSVDIVSPVARRVWVPALKEERAMNPNVMADYFRRARVEVSACTVPLAWKEAHAWAAANDGVVCIAGSLFLAGEVLDLYGDGQQLFL